MFDSLRDLYQEVILDHGRSPRHMRRLEPFDAEARGDNPLCGDRVSVRVRRGADGRLADAAFEARGCAICIASADLMTALAIGRGDDEIRLAGDAFERMLQTGEPEQAPALIDSLRPLAGVHEYRSRIRCATLPWTALRAALDDASAARDEAGAPRVAGDEAGAPRAVRGEV